MEVDIRDDKRIFINLGNGCELSVIRNENGDIKLTLDNGNLIIAPDGNNSITLIGASK